MRGRGSGRREGGGGLRARGRLVSCLFLPRYFTFPFRLPVCAKHITNEQPLCFSPSLFAGRLRGSPAVHVQPCRGNGARRTLRRGTSRLCRHATSTASDDGTIRQAPAGQGGGLCCCCLCCCSCGCRCCRCCRCCCCCCCCCCCYCCTCGWVGAFYALNELIVGFATTATYNCKCVTRLVSPRRRQCQTWCQARRRWL